jgi:thiamine-monophosphate kinase
VAASSRSRGNGEFALLAKVRAAVEKGGLGRGVLVGIGDDCAVVRATTGGATGASRAKKSATSLVLTTDTMVEGVHFQRHWLSPRELGVRALRAAVSDIAAMGARPRWILLSLELPAGSNALPERDALALVRAVGSEAKRCDAALVGGNVSGAAFLSVTVTVIGETSRRPLLRRAAVAGDLLFVTGSLGGAAAGWRTLEAGGKRAAKRVAASGAAPIAARGAAATAAWRRPPLRIDFAAALASQDLVHAMIDVSDGLLQDLGHIAEESGVAIRVDAAAVPIHRAALGAGSLPKQSRAKASASMPILPPPLVLALSGGEDYELAFTAPPSARNAITRLAASHRTKVTVVGHVAAARNRRAVVTDLEGHVFPVAAAGFDHLRRHSARTTRAQ